MNLENKIATAKRVIAVSGSFCILISILLLVNFMQMKSADPIESRSLDILVERLSAEPGNDQLMNEIRELDLLVRKAYFTSIWQVRTGGVLLLIASIILILSLRAYYGYLSEIEKPGEEEEEQAADRIRSAKWVMVGILIIIIPSLIAAFAVSDPLEKYISGFKSEVDEETEVEQIIISSAPRQTISSVTDDTSAEEGTALQTATSDAEQEGTSLVQAEQTPVLPVFPGEDKIKRNHNSFRGPFGQGIIYHTNIPTEWDGPSGKNILWKTEIPVHAYNSPVIWDNRIYLTGANESKKVIYCYDANTGQLIWEALADNIPGSPATPPRTTEDTGLGAPTVAVNGLGVYAIFGTGDIIALDMNGKRLWAKNLGVPNNHYGYSSSLLTLDEKLFIQYDDFDNGRIICLNIFTGETIWDIFRESDISWSSPILIKVNNKYQLVAQGNPIVAAYDPETGDELWKVSAMSGEVGPSPAFGGGLVYAGNEYAKLVAINPLTGTIVWEDNYYLPEVSSPVFSNDLLFISTTYALVACFDAKTGEFLWDFDSNDMFYSSPMVAEGKVFVTDIKGVTYVFNSSREPDLIAENRLDEEVFTIPAFSNGRIYIRGEKNLYCIGIN